MILSILKNGFLRVAGLFLGFLVSFFVARTLSVTDAGTFFYIYAVVVFMTVFFRFGFSNYILKNCSMLTLEESGKLFSAILLLLVFVFFVVVVLVYLMSFFTNDDFYFYLLVMAPAFGGLLYLAILAPLFQSLEKQHWAVLSLNILYQFFFIVFVFSLDNPKLDFVFVIFSGSVFLSCVVSSYYLIKISEYPLSLNFDFSFLIHWRQLFGFWVVSLGGQWLIWGGTIIGGFFLSKTDVAYFSISQKVIVLSLFFMTIVNLMFQSKFSRTYNRDGHLAVLKLYRNVYMLSLSSGLLIISLIYSFSDVLLGLFGEEYLAASNLLKIMLLGILFAYILGPTSSLLLMVGWEKNVAQASFLVSLVYLILSVVFVIFFGVEGLSVAVSLSYALQFLLNFRSFYYFRKGVLS